MDKTYFEKELDELAAQMTPEQLAEAIEKLKNCRKETASKALLRKRELLHIQYFTAGTGQVFRIHKERGQNADRIMVRGAVMLNEPLVREYLPVIPPVKVRWLMFCSDSAVRPDMEIRAVTWNGKYHLRPILIAKGRVQDFSPEWGWVINYETGLAEGDRVTIGGEGFTAISPEILLKDECIPTGSWSGNWWQYRYRESGGIYEELSQWYKALAQRNNAEDPEMRTKNSTLEIV